MPCFILSDLMASRRSLFSSAAVSVANDEADDEEDDDDDDGAGKDAFCGVFWCASAALSRSSMTADKAREPSGHTRPSSHARALSAAARVRKVATACVRILSIQNPASPFRRAPSSGSPPPSRPALPTCLRACLRVNGRTKPVIRRVVQEDDRCFFDEAMCILLQLLAVKSNNSRY